MKEIYIKEFPEIDGLWFEVFSPDRTVLYAMAGKFENYLHVFNSSDPENLRHITNATVGDHDVKSFMVNNQGTVCVAGFAEYINIFKVELDKGLITHTKTINVTWPDQGTYTFTFSADGKSLFHRVGRGLTLKKLDVSDVMNPVYVGDMVLDYPMDHSISKFTVDPPGNTAYFSVPYVGIFIVNVTDIANSDVLSVCDSGVRNRFVQLDSNEDYLYISDLYQGFVVIDVRDKRYPKVMSSLVIRKYFPGLDIELRPMWFARDFSLAYLNTYEGVTLVVNLNNLYQTEIETTLTIWTSAFKVVEDYKYAIIFRYSKY
mmetsp:Transcript_26950/g.41072  ORF Transcript_26950/g.41072 Transcript_26950/m.41072 type:complete len:316 (-) Transcript_26950:3133-4080(-)